jgi:hypothetical protein
VILIEPSLTDNQVTTTHTEFSVEMDKKETSTANLQYRQLGVWKLWTAKSSGRTSLRVSLLDDLYSLVVPLRQLLTEIYSILGPGLLSLYLLGYVWRSIQDIMLLQFTSQLLVAVELAIREGKADRTIILHAVVIRVLCSLVSTAVEWQKYVQISLASQYRLRTNGTAPRKRTSPYIQSKIEFHYKEFLLQAQLNADMTARTDRSIKSLQDASEPWKGFKSVVDYATCLMSALNQLLFLRWSLPSTTGLFFALLSLVQPIMVFTGMQIRVWQQRQSALPLLACHLLRSATAPYSTYNSFRQRGIHSNESTREICGRKIY